MYSFAVFIDWKTEKIYNASCEDRAVVNKKQANAAGRKNNRLHQKKTILGGSTWDILKTERNFYHTEM